METAYLYIVLTRTNTMISRLIHLFTHDDYTHAALALDEDLQEMYSFARKHTYNPFIGRFKHEHLDQGVYGLANQLPGVILELEVPLENYQAAQALVDQFIANSKHYKYNLLGLIYGLIDRPTSRQDRFLCSQFVYYILRESGIADFHIPANLVKPQDFLRLEGRIVYEGDLKQFIGAEKTDSLPVRVFHWLQDFAASARVS